MSHISDDTILCLAWLPARCFTEKHINHYNASFRFLNYPAQIADPVCIPILTISTNPDSRLSLEEPAYTWRICLFFRNTVGKEFDWGYTVGCGIMKSRQSSLHSVGNIE